MENRNDGQSTAATPADDEIAREGAALGAAGISRSTGTGSAGSGIAAAGGADQVGPAHHGTTGATTNSSDDLADAAGPSGAEFGSTGTAGSGLGAASTPVSDLAGGAPQASGGGS